MARKTQTIAGHNFTLIEGENYVASRPIARMFAVGQRFPVTIWRKSEAVNVVVCQTIDEANELLAAFNNGACSLEGRTW